MIQNRLYGVSKVRTGIKQQNSNRQHAFKPYPAQPGYQQRNEKRNDKLL